MAADISPPDAYRLCRKLLPEYPVAIDQSVAWGEMDSFGHVNNIVYFRYFESARMAYFHRIGFDEAKQSSVGPILAETQCRFRAALVYPDYISIGAKVSDIGEDRFTMHYAIASHRLNRIAAQGSGLIVSYDYRALKKAPLPANIIENIKALESADMEKE